MNIHLDLGSNGVDRRRQGVGCNRRLFAGSIIGRLSILRAGPHSLRAPNRSSNDGSRSDRGRPRFTRRACASSRTERSNRERGPKQRRKLGDHTSCQTRPDFLRNPRRSKARSVSACGSGIPARSSCSTPTTASCTASSLTATTMQPYIPITSAPISSCLCDRRPHGDSGQPRDVRNARASRAVANICAAYQDREGEGLQDSGQLPHIAEQDVRWPQRPPAC